MCWRDSKLYVSRASHGLFTRGRILIQWCLFKVFAQGGRTFSSHPQTGFSAMSSLCFSTGLLLLFVNGGHGASFSTFCRSPQREYEGGTFFSRCERSEATSTMVWRLVPQPGRVLDLGHCVGQNARSPLAPTITVDCESFEMELRMRNVQREHAGTFHCRETLSNGTTETAECSFSVYSTGGVVRNCGAQLHRSNWSFDASCDVEKVFTTTGHYQYSVRLSMQTQDFLAHAEPIGYTGPYDYSSWRRANITPTPYNDSSSGKEYARGRISYSSPLPKYKATYSLEMWTYPGAASNSTGVIFSVERPSRPAHNCQDLNFIPENGEVPCVCSTESVGSPEGRLIWFSGDTVLAAGDYGVTQLQFPPNEVDRRHDGVEMWCQLDWIIKTNVSVTNSVAYGPDRVAIEHWKTTGQDGARAVVVTCSPTGVNPLSFDMIRWGGRCQGQSGFTCVVSMATLDEGEVEVSCTAVNAANNGHSASMSVRITVEEPDTTTVTKTPTSERPIFSDPINEPVGDDRRAGMMKGVAIGCGVALGVLAAVVAVVLFVLWKRGCMPPCSCFDGDKNKNTSTRPSQHDLNLYEIPEQTPSEEITSRHARAPYTGAIYQNIHT